MAGKKGGKRVANSPEGEASKFNGPACAGDRQDFGPLSGKGLGKKKKKNVAVGAMSEELPNWCATVFEKKNKGRLVYAISKERDKKGEKGTVVVRGGVAADSHKVSTCRGRLKESNNSIT